MSYSLVKNLKVDEKTGIVSGEFATNNVYNEYGKHEYRYNEDIYQDEEGTFTPLQKYSRFIFDILSGAIQGSVGKYDKLSIKNFCKDVSYFRNQFPNEDPFVLAYMKYKENIENNLKEKPKYIVKLGENTYLEKLNRRTYRTTSIEEKAHKFFKNDFNIINRCFDNAIMINIDTRQKFNPDQHQDIIPSEFELNYRLENLTNFDFKETFQKIINLSSMIDSLNNKEIEPEEIKKIYNEKIKEISNDKDLFILKNKNENKSNNIVSMFLELKKIKSWKEEGKSEFYVQHNIRVSNLENSLERIYEGGGISPLLFCNEQEIIQTMFYKEKEFEEELENIKLNEYEDEEDLEE